MWVAGLYSADIPVPLYSSFQVFEARAEVAQVRIAATANTVGMAFIVGNLMI
jgi:hypothetical protein